MINKNEELLLACRDNYLKKIKELFEEGADVNPKYKDELAPLLVASSIGHKETEELLLNREAHEPKLK